MEVSNYRHISLKSIFAKIIEHVFTKHKTLNKMHFGFKKAKSINHPYLLGRKQKVTYGVPQETVLGLLLFNLNNLLEV